MKFGARIWQMWINSQKNNNGPKYLLVRQNTFDKTVDSKRMKTKDSINNVRAFSTDYKTKSVNEFLGLQGHRKCWKVLKTLQS